MIELSMRNILLVLVVLFLLYFFMGKCGCRVEGFDKQYNFVYPKCSYAEDIIQIHQIQNVIMEKNGRLLFN